MKKPAKNKTDIINNEDHDIIIQLRQANKLLQQELEECRRANALQTTSIEDLNNLIEKIRDGYARSEDAITIIDITEGENYLKIFDMNPMARKIFNVTDGRIEKGLNFKDILSAEEYRVFIQEQLPLLKKGITVAHEDDKGSLFGYWDATIYPMKDKQDNISFIALISRNVTAEHENRKLSVILQAAIDSFPFEIWIRNASGIEMYQNKTSREAAGNLVGTKLEDQNVPEQKIEKYKKLVKRVLEGEFVTDEASVEKDGKRMWLSMILNPIITDREIIGYTAIQSDISDRKNTEEALRNSEERFRLIARLSKKLIYDYNLITGTVEWDGAVEEVTGFSPGEYRNVRFEEWVAMIHPDDKEDVIALFEKSLEESGAFSAQYRYQKKDGEYIWIEENSKVLELKDGKPSRIIGVMKDITDRKKADEFIYKSQKLLNDSQRIAHIGSWEYYYREDKLLWNEESYKILGIEKTEFFPAIEDFIHLVHPDERQALIDHFEKTVRENEFKDIEYRIIRPDGEVRSLLTVGALDLDDKGNAYRSFGIIQDITERKNDEKIIRRNNERYDLVTKLSGFVVFDHDLRKGKVKWAGAIEELTGYTPEELSALSPAEVNELHHPDDLKIIMSQAEFLTDNFSGKLQYRFNKKNHGYIWVEANAFLFTDNNNKPARWLGIMRDITEQKRINEIIKESEEKLRKIFDTSKDGILLINKNMEILEINISALVKTRYTNEELIGRGISTVLSDAGVALVKQYITAVSDPDSYTIIEEKAKIKDGSVFPVEFYVTSLHLRDQEAFLIMARDISDRKEAERKLLNSVISTEERERLYFSQELHDGLGPLLSAAKLYTEWLADTGLQNDQEKIILDIWKILEEANKSIREISFKLSPHTLQNYGLSEALKTYANKIQQTTKIKITISDTVESRFENTIETILYRVLCECINNTIKHADAKNIFITMELAGNILNATYTDDGKGFDIEKTIENRKGIGLLNMESRVKAANGTLSIDSVSGKGIKVEIKIPVRI